MADPTPLIQGKIKTIKWGTKGAMQGALAEAIVNNFAFDQIIERSKIIDGDGFTVVTVTLVDGMKCSWEVIFDTSKEWPEPGAVINLKLWGHKINGVANPTLAVEITGKSSGVNKKGEATLKYEAELYHMFTAV